ncbi:MAG: DNA repair exonuclease [Magnetococcales bacterium]|nr:DNA repair exonuclease [Magnetococcales bacterium]
MRFIHAADIHLDSPCTGLPHLEGNLAQRLAGATREAFTALVDEAVARRIDLLLIAGDLFDGPWKDFSTGLFLVRQLGRLREAGIPVCLVLGNHDAESPLIRDLPLPENVFCFDSAAPETRLLPATGAAVHGWSYPKRDVLDNPLGRFPGPHADLFNIGLLHTAAEGREGHAPYAPCRLPDLKACGYDYWALGHIHQRECLSDTPPIHFPGNLQGRNVRECGAKGFLLVETFPEDGGLDARFQPIDLVRWEHLRLSVGQEKVLDDVEARLGTLLSELSSPLNLVRITFDDLSPNHVLRRLDPESLRMRCQALAEACNAEIVIESVRLEQAARVDISRSLPTGSMRQLLHTMQNRSGHPEFRSRLLERLAALRKELPAPLAEELFGGGEPSESVLQEHIDTSLDHLLRQMSEEER